MSREGPILPSKPPKPGSWWIKVGVASVALLTIAGVSGLEVRREQLRSVLREAAHPPTELPSGPRPVFFNEPTPGEWVECAARLPWGWGDDAGGSARWADAIVDCASRTELGETSRYLSFNWSASLRTYARELDPRRCARLSFAILRFAHDVQLLDRAPYGSHGTASVRDGLDALTSCRGDDALRAEMLRALEVLEADVPAIGPAMDALAERQRRRAYGWLARTAWDYDDPFFYETSGLLSRYARQFREWSRWRRLSDVLEGVETVEDAGRHLRQLRTEEGLVLGRIEDRVEHLALVRAARMHFGAPPLLDPHTGRLMQNEGMCVRYSGGAFCASRQQKL